MINYSDCEVFERDFFLEDSDVIRFFLNNDQSFLKVDLSAPISRKHPDYKILSHFFSRGIYLSSDFRKVCLMFESINVLCFKLYVPEEDLYREGALMPINDYLLYKLPCGVSVIYFRTQEFEVSVSFRGFKAEVEGKCP